MCTCEYMNSLACGINPFRSPKLSSSFEVRGKGPGAGFGVRSENVVVTMPSDEDPSGVKTVMMPATIIVEDGKVAKILKRNEMLPPNSCQYVLDFGTLIISPGFVDVHVHYNEPGRGEKEGFYTGTRAAAAGGVTTTVDMPLNGLLSTIDVERFEAKLAVAEGKLAVDTAYWGGFVTDNTANATVVDSMLRPLLASGVAGAKAFLNKAGEGFNFIGQSHLENGIPALVDAGVPLLVHAEIDGPPDQLPDEAFLGDYEEFSTFLIGRPRSMERDAIELLLDTWKAQKAKSRLHIVHLADSESLPMLVRAKAAGMNLTVETGPQYLYFAEHEVPRGKTAYKCKPPIRTAADRDALWAGVLSGDVDIVASDHAPGTPEEKMIESGDFVHAFAGISSLQLDLPITWTSGKARGLTPETMARFWSQAPAEMAGLSDIKGDIMEGKDADFVVWDPSAEFVVNATELYHRHPITPFDGKTLQGEVKATFVRGGMVYADGKLSKRMCGKSLLRGQDF